MATNPSASFTASMCRFSSALNVVTLGCPGCVASSWIEIRRLHEHPQTVAAVFTQHEGVALLHRAVRLRRHGQFVEGDQTSARHVLDRRVEQRARARPLEVLDRCAPAGRPSARQGSPARRSAHPCSCARAGGRGRPTSARGVGPSHTTRAVVRSRGGPRRGEVRGEHSGLRAAAAAGSPVPPAPAGSRGASRKRVSGVSRGTDPKPVGASMRAPGAAACNTSACRMGRRSSAASSASRPYSAPPTPRRRNAGCTSTLEPRLAAPSSSASRPRSGPRRCRSR